jgi:hypothetical protein
MFWGFFIARVITGYVNEHKEIFALYFGTVSGDAQFRSALTFAAATTPNVGGADMSNALH